MLNEHKNELIVTLTASIEDWLEKTDDIPRPFLGHNISEIMAQAAMCVMLGIADSLRYLEEEGFFSVGE